MARLKVFGGSLFVGPTQCRAIVAATSQRAVAEAAHESLNYVRSHWGETGNATEIRIAMARPGQVFVASGLLGNDFRPVAFEGYKWIGLEDSTHNQDSIHAKRGKSGRQSPT